ncbi:MAG: protein kinase, partial [Deferribacteraceae bacterium]|nr:protein kinase [Deferribacteraceae bacterium]
NPDFTNPEGLLICPDCHEKRIEEENARQAAKKAEEEHLCAQKAAEEAAAREKAAADAKAKEDAERALKEALAKAAELKRKEEEEKKRRIELEEKRLAEQKRKEAENKERQNRRCEVCGDAITDKNAPEICPNCQKDPMKVLFFLMQRAKKGTGDAVQIAGYRNVKLLGQGGMGQVWLVEEEATGKQMALKVILPQAAANDASRKMFMREAQIGGQLKHKNIVSQYTCGQSGNTYFILMELCEGGSVDDLLAKNGGKLNLTLATDIILQVLDGLDYAHKADVSVKLASGETVKAQGIVHRDFKPGNIFLTRGSNNRFTAKVADFGLAKAFETSGLSGFSKDGQVAGTPNYMPRQQILNYLFSKPAVDVWAAAASYYSMLTGFPPKDFPKGQDVFFSMLNNSAVPILKRNSSIPKKLAAVIDQALVEKPNIGVQSATELKKMIEGAL